MNILFYIPNLSQESGGVRQYAIGLLSLLTEIREHTFYMLHNAKDPQIMSMLHQNANLILIPSKRGKESKWQRKVYEGTYALNFLFNDGLNKKIRVRSYLDRLCRQYQIDIVHSPFQSQPFPKRVKNVFTLHDVQELHYPEYFTPKEREGRARRWLYNIENSDKIIVSYDHVKQDLIKYFQVDPKDIHVILLNMNKKWFSAYGNQDLVDLSSIVSFKKFLLYPANTWHHKNHRRLLQAISELKKNHSIEVNLVCTGHQNEHFVELKRLTKELNLQLNVNFLGVVKETVLYSLYQHCTGVVIPTIYEAGSFPLVESILMGVPVICSNVTSLPETIGDKTFTFNPFDVIEISSKIKQLWNDNSFREKNIINSSLIKNKLVDTNAKENLVTLYQSLKLQN